MEPTLRPPKGLHTRGRAFWRSVTDQYEVSLAEVELLTEACRTLDACEGLQQVVTRDGAMVAGSAGQPRVHPALSELRAARVVLSRLLAQLQLPDEDGKALPTAVQVRSRRANTARWSAERTGTAVSDAARKAALTRWHGSANGA